ncbi:MAG: hypothetical protein ACQEQF_00690 [Bacillota bacterium]
MSLQDVFLNGKYGVGNGLANYFKLPKNAIHQANTKEDIINTLNAFEDLCQSQEAMDFFEGRFSSLDDILINQDNKVKWIASILGFNPSHYSDVDTLLNSQENRDAILNSQEIINVVSLSNTITGKLSASLAGLDSTEYADMDAVANDETAMDAVANSSDAIDTIKSNITTVVDNMETEFPVLYEGTMFLQTNWDEIEGDSDDGITASQFSRDGYYEFKMRGDDANTGYVVFYSKEQFDFTDINEVDFDFEIGYDDGETPRLYLGINSDNTQTSSVFSTRYYDAGVNASDPRKTVTVDTSDITGMQYLKIAMYDDESSADASLNVDMYNIVLRK